MSVQDLYPSTSQNLKAEDLKGHAVKVIIEGSEVKEFDNGKKLVLKFRGKEKGLVLNKTNASLLAGYFGDDEREWNGKEIIVYPDKTTFGGQLVDCLRVRVEAKLAQSDDEIPW